MTVNRTFHLLCKSTSLFLIFKIFQNNIFVKQSLFQIFFYIANYQYFIKFTSIKKLSNTNNIAVHQSLCNFTFQSNKFVSFATIKSLFPKVKISFNTLFTPCILYY